MTEQHMASRGTGEVLMLTAKQRRNLESRQVWIGECIRWKTNGTSDRAQRLPRITMGQTNSPVRNVLWELANGPLPRQTMLVPTCGDKLCINPEHQQPIYEKQRVYYSLKKAMRAPTRIIRLSEARRARGKITAEQADEIRQSTEPLRVLAERYGITASNASQIRRGTIWRDYSSPWFGLGAHT